MWHVVQHHLTKNRPTGHENDRHDQRFFATVLRLSAPAQQAAALSQSRYSKDENTRKFGSVLSIAKPYSRSRRPLTVEIVFAISKSRAGADTETAPKLPF